MDCILIAAPKLILDSLHLSFIELVVRIGSSKTTLLTVPLCLPLPPLIVLPPPFPMIHHHSFLSLSSLLPFPLSTIPSLLCPAFPLSPPLLSSPPPPFLSLTQTHIQPTEKLFVSFDFYTLHLKLVYRTESVYPVPKAVNDILC